MTGSINGTLQGFKKSLDLAKRAIVTTPIDADPRVAGPLASLVVATGTLSGAVQALELLKRGIGGAASAGDFITQRGLDALLAVNSASFTADLNSASGGQVAMALSLTYRGTSTTTTLNFNDPLSGAQALGRQLLSI